MRPKTGNAENLIGGRTGWRYRLGRRNEARSATCGRPARGRRRSRRWPATGTAERRSTAI